MKTLSMLLVFVLLIGCSLEPIPVEPEELVLNKNVVQQQVFPYLQEFNHIPVWYEVRGSNIHIKLLIEDILNYSHD